MITHEFVSAVPDDSDPDKVGSDEWNAGHIGPWFNVLNYGATGDGTTDDTAAINSAIAAWNSAGEGVLYFPAGVYETTGALTTITASGIVRGDGMGAYDGSAHVSAVLCLSQTADLFTVTGKTVKFEDIGLFNTFAGTPSAGAGIQVSGSFIGQKVDYDSIVLSHFYDNIDVQVGAQWTMHNCWVWGPVRYGIAIQNTVNQDAGDWAISDSYFYADTFNGTAAIFQTGAGGGKIANTKINGANGETFTTGISVAIPNGVGTSVLTVVGCSIENVSGDAILITTTGTGQFHMVSIVGNEFALYSNNSGRCVKVSAASAGGLIAGGIAGVVIDGCTFRTDGTARAPIELVNTDRVTIGAIQLVANFTSRYTMSGATNTTDGGGSGTAFPAAAVAGSRFWRTDLGLECYYDGARWLTTKLYRDTFGVANSLTPLTTTTAIGRLTPWSTDFDLYLVAWDASTYVATTNNGTNFWNVAVNRHAADDSATEIDSFNTNGDTVNNWTRRRRTLNAVYTASTGYVFSIIGSLNLAPGGLYGAFALEYRLIVT